MSQWEHINANLDTDYTDLKKSESTNFLAIEVRKHLNNNYENHIKIFTDAETLATKTRTRGRSSLFLSAGT